MAFPVSSGPLSPLSSYRDNETSSLFELPYTSGPDPTVWNLYFNSHSNDLNSVGMAFGQPSDWYQHVEGATELNPDAGQYRPQQQFQHNDFSRPEGLSIYTTEPFTTVEDVPVLTATDTSVTTTGTSPEEFRSPLRTASIEDHSSIPRQSGRNFSADATAILREWFDQNLNDPYPSKETKDDLASRSGLKAHQVNNWFINARKRLLPKAAPPNVVFNALTGSPDQLSTPAFSHEAGPSIVPFPPFGTELEPLVEHEHHAPHQHMWPTSVPHGLLSPQTVLQPNSQVDYFQSPSSAGSNATVLSQIDFRIPPSSTNTSPSGTVIPRNRSNSSFTSQPERSPIGSLSRRGLRRHYRGPGPHSQRSPITSTGPSSTANRSPIKHENSDSNSDHDPEAPAATTKSGEIFQCTFPNCGKTFSSKTWKRHEETKHLPRFQWTCMATGFIVQQPATTTANPTFDPFGIGTTPAVYSPTSCAFCGKLNPDPNTHAQECEHRVSDCLCRPGAERTFTRKDHLFQHLRNFHRFTPADTSFGAEWKSKVEYSNRTWGCGFCGERLGSWEKRARHLRTHFREGWRVETGWDERKVKGYGFSAGYR